MFRRNRKFALAVLAVACLAMPAVVPAQGGTLSEAEKIKAVASTYHAAGKKAVSVEMKDGRSYKGEIIRIEEEHFNLLDPDAKREVQIRYESVAKMGKNGMSKAAKTAIWIGVGAGIGALIIFGRSGRTIGPICPLGCGL